MPNQYTKVKDELTEIELRCIEGRRKFIEHMVAMCGMLAGAAMFFSIGNYAEASLLIGAIAGYAFKNGNSVKNGFKAIAGK